MSTNFAPALDELALRFGYRRAEEKPVMQGGVRAVLTASAHLRCRKKEGLWHGLPGLGRSNVRR